MAFGGELTNGTVHVLDLWRKPPSVRRDPLTSLLLGGIGFAEMFQRPFLGYGLHSPHTRRHAAFLQNLDQPNLARRTGVCTAAKLGRKIADPYHAHLVAILFAKQRHGVILADRLVDRNI